LRGFRRICFGRVTHRLALLFALAAALAPMARAEQKTDLSADSTIAIDDVTGDLIAKPNARLVDKDFLLTADEIRYNEKTLIATATGHVILTRIGDRLLADRLTYNRSTGIFTARNLRAGRFPFYIEGPTAEGTRTEVVVHDATVTYREPGKWQPVIKAKTLTYSPGHYLRMAAANIGIGNYLPVPIARLGQDLAHQASIWNVSLDGGYRHTLGPVSYTHLDVYKRQDVDFVRGEHAALRRAQEVGRAVEEDEVVVGLERRDLLAEDEVGGPLGIARVLTLEVDEVEARRDQVLSLIHI